jgi:hypothetical protein
VQHRHLRHGPLQGTTDAPGIPSDVGTAVPPSTVQCSATLLQDSDDEKTGAVKASGNLFIAVVGAGVLGLPYGEALFCQAGHPDCILHRAAVSEVTPSATETPAKTGGSVRCSLPAERPGPGRGVPHPGGCHRAVLHAAARAVQAVRHLRWILGPAAGLQATIAGFDRLQDVCGTHHHNCSSSRAAA